ncbi:hypothetical protein ACWDDN_32620 [Streptomyces griseoruber]
MFVRIADAPERPLSRVNSDDFGRSRIEVAGLGTARLLPRARSAGSGGRPTRITSVSGRPRCRARRTPRRAVTTKLDSTRRLAESSGWTPDADHVRAHCKSA